jgi:hypothetical protein
MKGAKNFLIWKVQRKRTFCIQVFEKFKEKGNKTIDQIKLNQQFHFPQNV